MRETERALIQEFITALSTAADIHVLEQREEVEFRDGKKSRLDAILKLHIPDQTDPVELAVEAEAAVYPRDARRLIDYLTAFNNQRKQSEAAPTVPVVVALHLSEGARNLLREAGVNYFDASSGTLFYRYGTWLIDRERPATRTIVRRIGSVFNGAREQVVHALLNHWLKEDESDWIAGNELAVRAETSPFTVSKTLQELEKNDWIETTGSGPSQRRRVKNASALLDAWADEWTRRTRLEPRTRWYTYAGGRGGIVDRVLEKLASYDGWAVTGAAAANARVPHLTTIDRVLVIVPVGSAEVWAGEMNFEPTEKGSNITFIERSGASLLFLDEHPERPGSRFASAFVQYLDLLDGVGRNKELAREYRSRVLKLEDAKDD